MSQAKLLPTVSPSVSLPPLTYKGLPVVTTEMLAKAYGCDTASIRNNFNRNRERFTEGKHFYSLTNGDLKAFRDCVSNCYAQGDCVKTFDAVVPARTRNLTLWLERGAARHAKMLNTDQAWDVFEMLEETFFRVVKPTEQPSALTPSSADDRKPLRSLVHAWAQIAGTSHTALWPQVKAHFQLARIDDLPVEWIGDALAFVQGKIDAAGKALPEGKQEIAESPIQARIIEKFPKDMGAGRKQALKKIEDILKLFYGLRDTVRLFTHPGGYSMGRSLSEKEQYEILLNLYRSADANLAAAYNALEAGYRLGREVGRG